MLFRTQHFRVQYFVDLSVKYDLSPQNGTRLSFIYKLSNLFYFIKLTSISANAFTDSKFKVFDIQSSIGQKMYFKP